MKTLGQLDNWHEGKRDRCQSCTELVEFEGLSGELQIEERGEYAAQTTYSWVCPTCGAKNLTSASRLRGADEAR